MPLLFHNTEVHPLFVASPCQRLDIYFLGRPSFLLGEYNLVFFITYPLRHKTYTKPLYVHKSKRNIAYSQRTQQKNQPGSSSPLSKCQSKPYEVSLFVPQTGYVPEYAILAQQEISDWRPFGLKADIRTMEKAQPAQAKKECVSHRLIYVTI